MVKIIHTERIPIKLWLPNIEEIALQQAKNLANLPFAKFWIAVMPDAHPGFGMPIGGILAAKETIIPNAVGVDIGCGMCAVKTNLKEINVETLKKIMGEIRLVIPLGFNHHKKPQDKSLMPPTESINFGNSVVLSEYNSALHQIGTLGGGNHFIEIQKGSDGFIWLMIHSGSRNIGFKVAAYYNRLAGSLKDKFGSNIPREWQLDFLPAESEEGRHYLAEMQYCVDFALANRELMMDRILSIVNGLTGAQFEPMINIAHNYAALEEHFGEKVFVHRKGATKADAGLTGIVPGSMGTPSYIVEGLGNEESFSSCSHGAGRRMGRNEAIRSLNLEEEQKKMEGIIHGLRNKRDLEEAPSAYKNIDEVMENQKDLVKIKVALQPLAVIKG